MARWMPVDSVDAIEGDPLQVHVTAGAGPRHGHTYVGQTDPPTPGRVVRRYRLAVLHAGVLAVQVGPAEYLREVTYVLTERPGGTTSVACDVVTTIPGLHRTAARMGAKVEQGSLDRALARLAALAEGRRPGWRHRAHGSAHPL